MPCRFTSTTRTAHDLVAHGAILLDVRMPEEFDGERFRHVHDMGAMLEWTREKNL